MRRALGVIGAAIALGALAACGALVGSSGSTSGGDVDGGATEAKVLADSAPYDGPVVPTGEADAGTGCPGHAGPKMIPIVVDGKTMCIDSTEVTRADYLPFIAADAGGPLQPGYCSWNTNFAPNCTNPTTHADDPVDCVDWCDAYAYCAWAGKRLCGRIGGGSIAQNQMTDPKSDQWFAACSRGGSRTYAYGSASSVTACAGNAPFGAPSAVASHPDCEGGFTGLFDMSGNVMEWEDACSGTSGGGDTCLARGGDFTDSSLALTCSQDYAPQRNTRKTELGFRCCADVP